MKRRPPRSTLFPHPALFRPKDGLATDPAVQTHEDALCLVFLETQLLDLADQLGDAKTIDVIRKTADRSEERTSELQSPCNLVCRLLLDKKKCPGGRDPARPR